MMTEYTVTFLPGGICVAVPEGATVLDAQIRAGLRPDAPCGGRGTCGKCRVVIDGKEVLACRTAVERDMTVYLPDAGDFTILEDGARVTIRPDGTDDYAFAFDIGTTTVVCYLLDGHTGAVLAQASRKNPQGQYGADVISRLQHQYHQ